MGDQPFGLKMDRRRFLGLGAAVGGGALLAACGSSTSSAKSSTSSGSSSSTASKKQTGPLVFAAEQDNSGTLARIVKQWNSAHPHTPVTYQTIPPTTNAVYSQYVTALAGDSSTPDILTMDVTYPATFAAAGWIKPLDEYLPSGFASQFEKSAIDIGMYQGKLYAIPEYIDCGQLYYRTDLLEKYHASVPKTIDELVTMSKEIQAAERKTNPNFWGFVWEGAKIEAIFDQFDEWLWGYGGELSSGHKVTLDTKPGLDALSFMYDTVYKDKISPPSESTVNPTDAVVLMQNGNALFMRNWVFAYALVNDAKQSKVAGKVANAPLPGKSAGDGHGCIGGWMFGINSHSKRPEAAWRFLQYLTSQATQKELSLGAGVLSARKDVISDPAVLAKSPNLKEMPKILGSAKSRPSIKNYPSVSASVQAPLNAVIANQESPSAGLKAAQEAVANAVVA